MNSRQVYLEAEMQTKEIIKLEKWYRMILAFSSIFIILAYWGLKGHGVRFILGIISVIFVIICVLVSAVINLGVKKGKNNVQNMLKLIEKRNNEEEGQ